MNPRVALAALSLSLAACASAPAPAPSVAVVPSARSIPLSPAFAPPASCAAITEAYSPLVQLRRQSTSVDGKAMDPSAPGAMSAALTKVLTAVRAARPEDAEAAKLLADEDARFTRAIDDLQAFEQARAASHPDEAHAAALALLRVADESTDLLAASHRRCDPPVLPKPVTGRLAPPVIQKIVRARFGEYRKCYEDGLRRDPKLTGRVAIKFVIARDGRATDVVDAYEAPPDPFAWSAPSEAAKAAPELPRMPDPLVIACILRSFRKLSFPEPEGGIVTVTYPIVFAIGD